MGEFIKLIDQYGFSMIAAAVLIYGIVQGINIAIAYAKEKLLDKADKSELEVKIGKRREADLNIQYLIDHALLSSDANRVTVMEFHNGGGNLSNLPFCFMSCTYETFKGVPSAASHMQNLSLSLNSLFIDAVQKGPYVILDTQNRDSGISGTAYEYLEYQGARFGLYSALKNLRNQAIGTVSIKKNENFSESDLLLIRDVANKIGLLLTP